MASKSTASASLFLALNLILFVIASSCGTCPGPIPKPPKPGPPPKPSKCPADTLKLGVCLDLLGLIKLNLGKPPKTPCCSLIGNLADIEAAVCLCTIIKASVLGINLTVPVDLSLLLNYCGKKVPYGFQCA